MNDIWVDSLNNWLSTYKLGFWFFGTLYSLVRLTDTDVISKRLVLLTPLSQRNFPKERNINIDTLEISHLATYKAGFIQIRLFSIFAENIVLPVK
jgi:hypothetical protein